MINKSFFLSLLFAFCLFFTLQTHVYTSLQSPKSIQLLSQGQLETLPTVVFQNKPYISIPVLGKLSSAQVQYHHVSDKACLGNMRGELCLENKTQSITKDGVKIDLKTPLLLRSDGTFVPLEFILTKDFENFSGFKFHWNPAKQELSQNGLLSFEMPRVEKLKDRYRIMIEHVDLIPHYLLENSKKRVWLRFNKVASEGSQILEGDNVLRQIEWNQKRNSADLFIYKGPQGKSSEVFYDDGKKALIIDIFTKELLTDAGKAPQRTQKTIVSKKKKIEKTATSTKKSKPAMLLAPKDAAPSISPALHKREDNDFIVAIDAGHGGMDSGAIGARGTLEKNINLEMALSLASMLSKNRNTKVVLTRSKDEFIPLNQRTRIANDAKADLFVSIHCNSSLSPRHNGFEAYILSPDTTDKAAAAVARIENSVISLEVQNGLHKSRLEEMLASMMVQHQINNSSKLAALVCRGVRQKSNFDFALVKEADFFVLRGAEMPSVLIELEYLSNPISEIKLRSSRFRSKLANGIHDGIFDFFKLYEGERDLIVQKKSTNGRKASQK